MEANSFQISGALSGRVLGPLVLDFCRGLYQEVSKIHEPSNAKILFQARAGIRIKDLFDSYLERHDLTVESTSELMYVSRLSAMKGCLAYDIQFVGQNYLKEYVGYSVKGFLDTLDGSFAAMCPEDQLMLDIDFERFCNLYDSSSTIGVALRGYFENQQKMFAGYLQQLIQGAEVVYLIDSGWYGSTQQVLSHCISDVQWVGFYFGRWRYGRDIPEHYSDMKGICIDDINHSRVSPRRLLLCYNHLIEGVFEPAVPSTCAYELVCGKYQPVFDASDSVEYSNDELYEAVIDWVAAKDNDRKGVVSRICYRLRYWVAAYFFLFPSSKTAANLSVAPRQANMGKGLSVEVILDPRKYEDLSWRVRYRKALWKPGQIALEFPSVSRLPFQFLYLIKFALRN